MNKNQRDILAILIIAIFLFTVIGVAFGIEVAKALFSISRFPALIITGLIAVALGLKRSKWSGLFGIIAIILLIAGS